MYENHSTKDIIALKGNLSVYLKTFVQLIDCLLITIENGILQ